ncbi:MAG: gamma-glutamyltranspeptidase / glutathione hydrolase [Blastocatellia bacterium]|jgi:gamma-glutamyltranspeptidase/glutathione hydrolase|nr:gamma-glutamyltranspeptidase / glutathione hydrolase [Blastocatellia bacterium]
MKTKTAFVVRALFVVAIAFAVTSTQTGLFLSTHSGTTALAASRDPIRAPHGLVASTNQVASQVGVDVMKRGGNAVDAAIAVAFALAVTHPAAGNLGGGGFMMIRLKNGKTTAIDYREMAPAAATRNTYLDQNGDLIKGEGGSLVGYRAAGVPGTVRGMELALRKYGSGKLNWSQLIEPARRLAANGFAVTYALERSLRGNDEYLSQYPDTKRIYLNNGKFYDEGNIFRQPELAATFARLQRGGPNEFYVGETARLIVDDVQRHKGLITQADMSGYVARERAPLRGTYRGYEVISMPPPSSGGAVLIEMLNILEGFDLKKTDSGSSERYHLMTESMRRAFADRAEYMGDTDFVNVPVAGLVDKDYAARLRRTISAERASTSEEVRAGRPKGYESEETTHFTVVDAEGNAVANTYTLNNSYGSAAVAKGTGIILNDEMDDFAAKPGTPNMYGLIQGERNAVAPRKRPLSAMTPTFVLRKDGSLWFTVGSPGGPTIINTAFCVITNVIDFSMNMQQAIDAPRIHHQWLPDELVFEPYGLSGDTQQALLARGHKLAKPRYLGEAEGIMIEEKTGMRLGATDPRRSDGVAVGY